MPGRGVLYMMNIFRDGFYKTLVVVAIVGILVSSLIASGVSVAVDKYFNRVVSGIIGDAGEYDIIVHIRSEMEDAGSKELERVISKEYPGSTVEEGVKLAGNSNYLISLPDEFKTAEGLGKLPNILRGIPGGNGYTIILEPRITLRLTHPNIRSYILDEINHIDGISFAYVNRGNVEVVLESEKDVPLITREINEMLSNMQIVEIRNEQAAYSGERYSFNRNLVKNEFEPYLIKDVSNVGNSTEEAMLVNTLVQIRNLLRLFTTQAEINIDPSMPIQVGDILTFPDEGIELQVTKREENVITGKVVDGDGVAIDGATGYYYTSDGERKWAGTAKTVSDRFSMINRINNFIGALEQLENPISDQAILEIMPAIDHGVASLADVLNVVYEFPVLEWFQWMQEQDMEGQLLSGEMESFHSFLNDIEVYFDQMGSDSPLGSTEWFDRNMENIREGLNDLANRSEEERQRILYRLEGLIGGFGDISEIPEDLKNTLEFISQDSTISQELYMEINQAIEEIANSSGLEQLNTIGEQARQVSMLLPDLSDEDINAVVGRIDTMLEGQNQDNSLVFITEVVDAREIEDAVYELSGHAEPAVFISPAGIVDSSVISILFNIIRDARGIIAALISLMLTVYILLTDHSIILSTYKSINRIRAKKGSMLYPHVYGIIAGSVIYGATFGLSGASIPYVNMYYIFLVGGILGFISNLLCEKISPVNDGELAAGLSLGLTMRQIMEEIIIPAGRPGLLFYLVSRKRDMGKFAAHPLRIKERSNNA